MKNLKIRANTMIEFIVILLIMLILGAVVTTNMASTKNNTNDTVVSANLKKIISLENSYRVENGSFTGSATMLTTDPNIIITNENSTSDKIVSLFVDNDGTLYLASLSNSGICYGKKVSIVGGLEEKVEDISIEATESCSADSIYG